MKLSTKSRYAVRALFDIAYHSDGLATQLKEISGRQQIGARYLEQVLHQLKRAGLLKSKRGPRGGYSLLLGPEEISIYDVVAATDGPIELVFCVGDDGGVPCDAPKCGQQTLCSGSPLWKVLGNRLADEFRHTTIRDLCLRAEELGLER